MASDQPLDHVYRPSLPWRDEVLTECGRTPDPDRTITSDQLRARVRKLGKQRTALLTCMTCLDRVGWTGEWNEHPIGVLAREIKRVGYVGTGRGDRMTPEQQRLTSELRAIAALIETHRDEFDQFIAGLDEVITLDGRRKRRG